MCRCACMHVKISDKLLQLELFRAELKCKNKDSNDSKSQGIFFKNHVIIIYVAPNIVAVLKVFIERNGFLTFYSKYGGVNVLHISNHLVLRYEK